MSWITNFISVKSKLLTFWKERVRRTFALSSIFLSSSFSQKESAPICKKHFPLFSQREKINFHLCKLKHGREKKNNGFPREKSNFSLSVKGKSVIYNGNPSKSNCSTRTRKPFFLPSQMIEKKKRTEIWSLSRAKRNTLAWIIFSLTLVEKTFEHEIKAEQSNSHFWASWL